MAYQSYEKLEVWQRSVEQSVKIYQLLSDCRDYGFKNQICRAAVSIPSNIAEGVERDSVKETTHFLHIAKGSCAEVRTQAVIAVRIGYLPEAIGEAYIEEMVSISKMLHGLIRSLKPKA